MPPSRGWRTCAIFLTGDDNQRRTIGFVLHRGVVDRHDFAIVARHAAFDAGDHFVLDADVGEGAAHHDFVVAAAGAVAVEVGFANLMFHKEFSGWRVGFDRTGG